MDYFLLTPADVQEALKKGTPRTLKDGAGLNLRIRGVEKGSWTWRGRIKGSHGEACTLTLGKTSELSLEEARRKAEEARALALQGGNPRFQQRQERMLQSVLPPDGNLLFKAVAEQWMASVQSKRSQRVNLAERKNLETYLFPLLGNRPFLFLTREDYRTALYHCPQKKEYLIRLLSRSIANIELFALTKGIIQYTRGEHLSIDDTNIEILPPHISLQLTTLRDALKAIRKAKENTLLKRIVSLALELIPLLLLPTEALRLGRWEEIDFEKKTWTIPGSRTRTMWPFVQPLSSQAITMLTRLHEITGETEFLFPSVKDNQGCLSHSTLLFYLHMVTNGKVNGISITQFRQMFKSLLKSFAIPQYVIDLVLGYKYTATTNELSLLAFSIEKRRIALQWWADYLDALREGRHLPPFPKEISL